MQDDAAEDMHAAKGHGLRDGPLHGSRRDLLMGVTEKPSAARQKVQVALLWGRLASAWTLPVMWTASGVAPRPIDFGVEADGDVDLVIAGKKEEGIALGAELAVLLEVVDFVDLLLDFRCRAWRD
jgi:hypothetical protein